MAIAEQEGSEFVNYAITFRERLDNSIDIIPSSTSILNPNSIENVEKLIKIKEAPDKFGDEMSKGDKEERDKLLLKKAELKRKDKVKLTEVRKSLGI